MGVADATGYSFQYLYTLADDRRMLGRGTIYQTGTSPPTPTNPAAASRLLFQFELGAVTLSHPQSALSMITVDHSVDYANLANQIESVHLHYEASRTH